jgi:hypothetical protein
MSWVALGGTGWHWHWVALGGTGTASAYSKEFILTKTLALPVAPRGLLFAPVIGPDELTVSSSRPLS